MRSFILNLTRILAGVALIMAYAGVTNAQVWKDVDIICSGENDRRNPQRCACIKQLKADGQDCLRDSECKPGKVCAASDASVSVIMGSGKSWSKSCVIPEKARMDQVTSSFCMTEAKCLKHHEDRAKSRGSPATDQSWCAKNVKP